METTQNDTRCESICLRNQICFPLYACAKEVIRQYRRPLEALGLTYTQYIVMMVLWEQGDMTESALGHTVRLDSGTLTPLLKRLEKQGLIVRTHPESRERKLFQSNSIHQLIPGRREDLSITNRGFVDSAVGLVVDVLKDARQVVDSLTALAEGKGGPDGVGTLHKQYPFLTDAPERELLEQYRARLAELKGPGHEGEREVLKRAQEKAEAIIGKKDQMKRDFLQRLRQLSHSAAAAEAAFTSEEFIRQAAQRLEQPEAELPPDGGEDGPGDDAGADGREPD